MTLLAYGLIALAILGSIGTGVYKVKQWGANEERAEWLAKEATAKETERLKSFAAATGLQSDRAKATTLTKTRTVYVDREITKLVDSGTCLKPAGVQCVNAAIGGKECRPQPDGTVPAVKPPG